MFSKATWRSGDAPVCKTGYAGSIPAVASTNFTNTSIGVCRTGSTQTTGVNDTLRRPCLDGEDGLKVQHIPWERLSGAHCGSVPAGPGRSMPGA